jgi:predicted ArsR family transcriptional regulator
MEEILNLGNSKKRILEELMDGSLTINDLSGRLNIQNNAIREHLDNLENMGYISYKFTKSGVGRPKKYYFITRKGMELFPKKYDLLLRILLEELTNEQGKEWVRNFLKRAGERIVKNSTGQERDLESLINFYNGLGCMASAIEKDGNIVIKRKNCIYYNLALENENLLCSSFEDSIIHSIFPSYKITKKDTVSKEKFDCEITLSKADNKT